MRFVPRKKQNCDTEGSQQRETYRLPQGKGGARITLTIGGVEYQVDAHQTHGDVTVYRCSGPRGGRFYATTGDPETDGLRLPSVTGVLNVIDKGPGLQNWFNAEGRKAVAEHLRPTVGQTLTGAALDHALKEAAKRPERTRQEAADIGSRAHRIIESVIKGEIDLARAIKFSPDSMVRTVLEGYEAFLEENPSLEIVNSELIVYCPECKVGGTADVTGWIRGQFALGDWKTSNRLYKETAYQVAGYAHSWKTMGHEVAEKLWAVRLGKEEPEFETQEIDFEIAERAYKSAVQLYHDIQREPFTTKKVWRGEATTQED